jgi:translocation protein SEC63
VLKGNALIHAHLHRAEISPSLRADLLGILANASILVDAMMELAQSQRWLQTSVNIMDFSQCLTQALWIKDHSLAQLPHFSEKEIQHCTRGKGAVRGLREYLRVPDEQKKGLSGMADIQCADVMRVCELMPMLQSKFELYVEDEVEIAERDLVTLRINFDRLNISDGKLAPPIHAPRFPTTRLETWWILVSDRADNLILADKITSQSKIVDHRVKFLAPPLAGTYIFNIDLKSADYLGLDIRQPVKMIVIPAADLPAYTAHPDDIDLDDEPTLFEQVMSTSPDTDSETDGDSGSGGEETDENGNDHDGSLLTEAERRRRKARIQRKRRAFKKVTN